MSCAWSVYSKRDAGHKHLRPKSIHDKEILDEFAKDYMYFACIQFINSVCPRLPHPDIHSPS